MPKPVVVKNLRDFLSHVEGVHRRWQRNRTTPAWFRGQADSSWSLLPGLYRGKVSHELEREITRDFHLYSSQFSEAAGKTELERLFVMQHFGLPTRLLDWTESHLVALYFAVVNHDTPANAAVFVLDPWRLNEQSIGQRTVPAIDHPSVESYALGDPHQSIGRLVAAKDPIAVRPPHATGRIRAQNGFFTIHGHDQQPLDQLSSVGLSKIVIAGASKTAILRELVRAGVSPKTVFPDLSGLCEDIALRYSERFMLDPVRGPRNARRPRPKVMSRLAPNPDRPAGRVSGSPSRSRYVASAVPRPLVPEGFGSPPKPIKVPKRM